MSVCNNCGADLPDDLKFCISCGRAINGTGTNKKCAVCGMENLKDIKFCISCGTSFNEIDTCHRCKNCGSDNPEGINYCISCGHNLRYSPADNPAASSSFQTQSSNNSGGPGMQAFPSPWPAPTATSFSAENKGNGKPIKKINRLKVSAIIGAVVLVCFTAFILRESIGGLIGGGGRKEISSEAEVKPGSAPMPASGTKAFKIAPAEGLTISAEKDALDKERVFKAYRLADDELYDAVNKLPYGYMVVFDGYEVDAGLGSDEFFPGEVRLEFDLDKLDIPKDMMKYMGAVRVGKDGQSEILKSSVEGSKLVCQTNKNSVIVTTLLLGGLAAVSGYFIYDDLGEKNLWKFPQYKGKKFYKTSQVPGYDIYWPEGMNFYNPDAVNKKVEEFNKVLAKYKIPTDKNIAETIVRTVKNENYKDYRSSVRTVLGRVFNDKDFIRLFEEVSKIDWQKENVWPTEVRVAIEALENADKYLFDVRKFKRPGPVIEIGILPIWPYDNKDVVGYSFNPKMGSPYMHINAEYPGIPWMREHLENPKLLERYQPGLDELNITVVHELFHVVQGGYVPVDWGSYVWFWEASVLLLENEAAQYYLSKNIIKTADSTTGRNYYETLSNTLGYTQYWMRMQNSESLVRHQAYTASWFFQFLRDRYYGSRKDEFLKSVLIRFMYQKDYVKALREQTSNSEMIFQADFKLFCAENAEKIRSRVSGVTKDSKSGFFDLTTGSYYRLDGSKPYNEIITEYNPLSTNIKFLDINYDESLYKPKDVYLVFKKSSDSIQQSSDMMIRFDQNSGRDFKSIGQDKIFKFENIKNLSGNIQEIHSYMESTGENSEKKYDVFMMLKPGKPKIKKKDNKLIITLPAKSPLFAKGFVDKYLVTIKDPKGQTIMLETDKNTLELKLNSTGDFGDLDSPEMKKAISAAARKYIDSNPGLKEELYGTAGKDVADKAIDSIGDLDIDYGVLTRAAEVLNEAITGSQTVKKYAVTVSEMTRDEKPIYGPQSDLTELEVETVKTGGINIYGTWEGKVQITNQKVTITIEQGKKGYDYTLKNSMYEGMEFYGKDNGNGTCIFGEDQGFAFTIIKNSENELYVTAPPITLRRK